MKKERETANKYRQQALEGDLMAMNNMGVCYAQGIGVVENHDTAFEWYMKAAQRGHLQSQKNVPPTFWGMFPHSFLIFHTIHFWHKGYKLLIINTN